MKKLATNTENRLLDKQSIETYLISQDMLTESAGVQSFLYLKENFDLKKVLVLCGKANNGGDALVISRYLKLSNVDVSLYFVDKPKSISCVKQAFICEKLDIKIVNKIDSDYTLILDGVFGSGLVNKVNKDYEDFFNKINSMFNKDIIVSLDQNSGYSDDLNPNVPMIKANTIINYGLDKISNYHMSICNKKRKVVDINPSFNLDYISTNSYLASFDDISLTSFKSNDFKNTRKHVLCFIGSKKYSGALRLSLRALYKTGIGLVSCFTDKSIVKIVGENHSSLILDSIDSFDFSNNYDSLLIGCGSDNTIKKDFLEKLLDLDLPTVIDASALKVFSQIDVKERKSKIIITPHLGEIKEFGIDVKNLSSNEIKEKLFLVSEKYKCDIILKSNVNWIICDNNLYIVKQNNPSIGVSGSGDILASICATFLAQNVDKACLNANLIHQLAGKNLKDFYPSEDLLDQLSQIIGKYRL